MKRKRIYIWELALIVLALLFLAGFNAIKNSESSYGTAYVSINGECVLELDLEKTSSQTISLEEFGVPASLEIKNHKVRFVDVTCPDHICEKTGWIWMDGQSAVCMPNRTAVVIVQS